MSDRIVVHRILIVKTGSVGGRQSESGFEYLNLGIVLGVNAALATFVVSQSKVFESGQRAGGAALFFQ